MCSPDSTTSFGDEVAEVVLRKFAELPTKAKPLNRGVDKEGFNVQEWVPLSGIVAKDGKIWWEADFE